jgi:hypothetical protein
MGSQLEVSFGIWTPDEFLAMAGCSYTSCGLSLHMLAHNEEMVEEQVVMIKGSYPEAPRTLKQYVNIRNDLSMNQMSGGQRWDGQPADQFKFLNTAELALRQGPTVAANRIAYKTLKDLLAIADAVVAQRRKDEVRAAVEAAGIRTDGTSAATALDAAAVAAADAEPRDDSSVSLPAWLRPHAPQASAGESGGIRRQRSTTGISASEQLAKKSRRPSASAVHDPAAAAREMQATRSATGTSRGSAGSVVTDLAALGRTAGKTSKTQHKGSQKSGPSAASAAACPPEVKSLNLQNLMVGIGDRRTVNGVRLWFCWLRGG